MDSAPAEIHHFVNEASKTDDGKSALLKNYQFSFRFTGSGFESLKGFGGNSKPRGIHFHAVKCFRPNFEKLVVPFLDF